jgi:hypothetical protein
MENTKENCEMIWKIWKKSKLNSEKIWTISTYIASVFSLSFHYFLQYFPNLFLIQLGFLPYCSYLFTIQLTFKTKHIMKISHINVNIYENYGRKVSWIVKRYGKYRRKASWNVNWYGQIGVNGCFCWSRRRKGGGEGALFGRNDN